MRSMRVCVLAGMLLGLSTSRISAQQLFDVGLLLGSTLATDEAPALEFDQGRTYQATFAWRVWRTGRTALSVEVPFIATPAFTTTTPGDALPKEYASLYLTPGVRATFLSDGPVSVWGSVGGGYARYSESQHRADGGPNPAQLDTNTGAFQFGAGVDVRGFGWLGFRGEVRDVYTGMRRFSIPTPGHKVHNVVTSGGLVVRF
jgi:hypothetical protein